jgi:hypothetical protein
VFPKEVISTPTKKRAQPLPFANAREIFDLSRRSQAADPGGTAVASDRRLIKPSAQLHHAEFSPEPSCRQRQNDERQRIPVWSERLMPRGDSAGSGEQHPDARTDKGVPHRPVWSQARNHIGTDHTVKSPLATGHRRLPIGHRVAERRQHPHCVKCNVCAQRKCYIDDETANQCGDAPANPSWADRNFRGFSIHFSHTISHQRVLQRTLSMPHPRRGLPNPGFAPNPGFPSARAFFIFNGPTI